MTIYVKVNITSHPFWVSFSVEFCVCVCVWGGGGGVVSEIAENIDREFISIYSIYSHRLVLSLIASVQEPLIKCDWNKVTAR